MSLTTDRPDFPPLLDGRAVAGDPVEAAVRAAQGGADPGLVLFDPTAADMAVAVILAPEVPLSRAAVMLPLAALAFQNAMGSIGPSELPVHLQWDGAIRINGARCGRARVLVPETARDAVPDWMVMGVELRVVPEGDGGETPDETALHAEGCGDLGPLDLTEMWARHALAWIHRWEEGGMGELHRDWSAIAHGLGAPTEIGGGPGTFLGVDEELNMLKKTGAGTRMIPLTTLLEIR